MRFFSFVLCLGLAIACGTPSSNTRVDAGAQDSDAGTSVSDSGSAPHDAGARPDAGAIDAGAIDAGATDAGSIDAGYFDAGAGSDDGGGGSFVDAGLSALNDEFTSAATASNWVDLYPTKHVELAIHSSRAGFLTMRPIAQSFTGWYSEYEGPLYLKTITGNFVAETSLVLGTATDRTVLPSLNNSYAQGGFVIRDARSTAFNQRWLMYNFGYQDSAGAREVKTTVPSANGTTDSLSTLNLNNLPLGINEGRLRVCRIGSLFRFFHLHPGESDWVEEVFRTTGTAPTRVFGNGPRPARADNSILSFDRPDFAAELQVGLYVGNYAPPAEGVRGEFDYVRFGDVSVEGDCLQPL